MEHAEILAREPKVLTRAQRQKYFEDGYVGVPRLIGRDWLDRLNAVTNDYIEQSRHADRSDKRVRPRSRTMRRTVPASGRLNSPIDLHDEYWAFASEGPFVDVAEDLLGPDVKFHHSKLNFKWGRGGEEVKWHQDIQFWPHTNYDVLTIGVYLDDVASDMAPMGVIPKSHDGPLFDLYDEQGAWTGNIRDADLLQGRRRCGRVSRRTGRHRDGAQLPEHPRFSAQRQPPSAAVCCCAHILRRTQSRSPT